MTAERSVEAADFDLTSLSDLKLDILESNLKLERVRRRDKTTWARVQALNPGETFWLGPADLPPEANSWPHIILTCLRVEVHAYNRGDNFSDAKVEELADEQNPLVESLDFNYEPIYWNGSIEDHGKAFWRRNKLWLQIPRDSSEWICEDWDNACIGVAKLPVTIFYKPTVPPEEVEEPHDVPFYLPRDRQIRTLRLSSEGLSEPESGELVYPRGAFETEGILLLPRKVESYNQEVIGTPASTEVSEGEWL